MLDKNKYLIKLSRSPETDYGKVDFAEQCFAQKVFSAIWELESLVNNGGFQGYFGNQAKTAEFAPTALRATGAHRCATIVEEAFTLLPFVASTKDNARWHAMHSLSDTLTSQFADLDSRFMAYPDNLTDLLFEFVCSHPEVFGEVHED